MPQGDGVRCYLQTSYKNALYLFADYRAPADFTSTDYAEITIKLVVNEWSGVWQHLA
jgi:hypothetical protein